jgi:chemotaxis protein methyltransferase CheR
MELTQQEVELFIQVLRENSDYDFGNYSVKSFTRRVEKILNDHQTGLTALLEKLKNNRGFLEQTVKDITVNTTEIFRDPEIWQVIRKEIIPKYKDEPIINIWHAGSSTGQEVFSLEILLKEAGLFEKSNIYATDLNMDVLETAKSGKYKYREIDEYINNYTAAFSDTAEPPMKDYIEISRLKSLIKIKPFLTEKPHYAKHDLTSCVNPFGVTFHIIMCRNVLIYFNHDLQNSIFRFFYENMKEKGTLIIGRHEGILGEIGAKFDKHGTIYFKKEN